MKWADDNPFYLLLTDPSVNITEGGRIVGRGPTENVTIDLGERGWSAIHGDWMRRPGRWHLVRKEGHAIVAMMEVFPGEQPYYVARHVGFAGTGAATELTAYGIGKKRLDGHVDRIWILSNGAVTLGDDLEPIAIDLLKRGLI